jgi:cobalt-zinc-cadmium efflux system protein
MTHVFALGMSYFAISLTARPANNWKTFGYYRAEVLAAFVNGIFLIIVTVLIVYEAVILRMRPAAIKTIEMFIVAVVGLGANLCSVFLLKSSTHGDLNIKSAFVHVIGDAFSSIMVIAGALIIYYTGNYIVDPILSIIISILILIWGGRLLRDSAYILLESTPKNIDLEILQAALIREIPEVIGVHDIHVWVLTSSLYCATMHLVVENIRLDCAGDLLAKVQDFLHDRFNIDHATILFEIKSDNCRHIEGVF